MSYIANLWHQWLHVGPINEIKFKDPHLQCHQSTRYINWHACINQCMERDLLNTQRHVCVLGLKVGEGVGGGGYYRMNLTSTCQKNVCVLGLKVGEGRVGDTIG